MREDMYKVIVERPRRGKSGDAIAARLRKDLDGPMRLGMRVGYGSRNLNENLAPLRRMVDERTYLLLLDGHWFRVVVDVLPKERFVETIVDGKSHRHVIAEPRYDVVLRRNISRAMTAALLQCEHLYGSGNLYATSKRQISTREIKAHGLRGRQ